MGILADVPVSLALRLYSPVSAHSRTARVDTVLPRGGGGDGLGPLVVRAGATVIWSTYSLNRDPRRYGPDWASFRPERWASGGGPMCASPQRLQTNDTTTTGIDGVVGGGNGDTSNSSPACKGVREGVEGVGNTTCRGEVGPKWRDFFMPFGSGPRSCLGQQMVQSEVAYAVVRLLQEFQEIRVGGVQDVPQHEAPAEPRQPHSFREAEAVSFYHADGVMIAVE